MGKGVESNFSPDDPTPTTDEPYGNLRFNRSRERRTRPPPTPLGSDPRPPAASVPVAARLGPPPLRGLLARGGEDPALHRAEHGGSSALPPLPAGNPRPVSRLIDSLSGLWNQPPTPWVQNDLGSKCGLSFASDTEKGAYLSPNISPLIVRFG